MATCVKYRKPQCHLAGDAGPGSSALFPMRDYRDDDIRRAKLFCRCKRFVSRRCFLSCVDDRRKLRKRRCYDLRHRLSRPGIVGCLVLAIGRHNNVHAGLFAKSVGVLRARKAADLCSRSAPGQKCDSYKKPCLSHMDIP